MQVSVCCRPGSLAVPNEDAWAATAVAVGVVDGMTSPTGMSTGCRHGTGWFARTLAALLVGISSESAAPDLRMALEEALRAVAGRHRDSCDLTVAGTPSAAVGLLRERHDAVEYLVLSDVTIVVETADGTRTVTDDRCSELLGGLPARVMSLPSGSPEREEQLVNLVDTQRRLRNVQGGYWLAGPVPEAARHAIVGSFPRSDMAGAAVLSDGATRLVELFRSTSWTTAMEALRGTGPDEWIDQTRRLEEADPDMVRWPRLKKCDDATVAVVRFQP